MRNILITGGAGFFGSLLKKSLLENGYFCVSVDLEADEDTDPNLVSVQGNICDTALMEPLFEKYAFTAVFHCAAILAHAVKDKDFLWESNVTGTQRVVDLAVQYKVPKIVFTSSNCLWAENLHRPVLETDQPNPIEIYGNSKWEGEKILMARTGDIDAVIFRCPTIMDAGRLGLLTILFEFIDEDRKVWVVGGGYNKYQFIYAMDLVDACLKAIDYKGSDIFNIGSDDVKSFRDVYNYVIQKSGTKARVASLPKKLITFVMQVCYLLKISPLGPYQYKMISEDFVFDTTKIKEKLHWQPTLTNEEIMYKAYQYYHDNRKEIENRKGVSAHKQAAKMGVIRILKWLS